MQVCEIFYSIQGEGTHLGQPAIFLRLQGCNLRCKFCDTAYSQEINQKKEMSISEILKKIKRFPARHIVITGGEPLLQQKELAILLKKLKNYFIEVETNGTIAPEISQYVDQFNCSPKLLNSTKNHITYNIKSFPKEKTIYKFVIDKEKNVKEVKDFIKKHAIQKNKVLLMPQGKTTEEIMKKSKLLIEICKKELFGFAPRLHIMLWNNQKQL